MRNESKSNFKHQRKRKNGLAVFQTNCTENQKNFNTGKKCSQVVRYYDVWEAEFGCGGVPNTEFAVL